MDIGSLWVLALLSACFYPHPCTSFRLALVFYILPAVSIPSISWGWGWGEHMKEEVASGARPCQSGLECGSEGKRRQARPGESQVKGLTCTACCEWASESWDFPNPTAPLSCPTQKLMAVADSCCFDAPGGATGSPPPHQTALVSIQECGGVRWPSGGLASVPSNDAHITILLPSGLTLF